MAAFVLFDCFAVDLANGVHDFTTHVFKVALTDTAPASTDTVFTDIVEIAAVNGYTAGGTDLTLSSAIAGPPVPIEFYDAAAAAASGGAIGPFRYSVIYNSTSAGGSLVGYADYGSSISVPDAAGFLLINMTPLMTIEVV